jgi:uncharacterized membrane protein YqhA
MDNIEDMELSLIGLTIVVLGVNFLSVIFEQQEINLAVYGIGYSLPIIALSYFMKVRSELKNNNSKHPMVIEEVFSLDRESTQLLNRKKG